MPSGSFVVRSGPACSDATLTSGWYFAPPLLCRRALFASGLADIPLRYAQTPLASREGAALLAAGRLHLDLSPAGAAQAIAAFPGGLSQQARDDLARDTLTGLIEHARATSLTDLLARPLQARELRALLPSAVRPLLGQRSALGFFPAPTRSGSASPAAARPYRHVLLVGLDGADWEIIDPLLEQGRLPNLRALIAQGGRARLRTLTPILSPLLWTSIATGVGPQRHGITDFVAASRETGAEIPVTSSMRRVPAIWNIASEHGLSAGIVGWWATWPAEPVSGFIVSDRVVAPIFGDPILGHADPSASLRRRTWPEPLTLSIQPLVVAPEAVPAGDLGAFVGPGSRALASSQEMLQALATTLAAARTYHGISLSLLEAYQPDLAAVYYSGTDTIAHQFMRYRAPTMAGVTPEEREAWGDVVDRYYDYQDRLLGELLGSASADSLVIVCSDHGFKTGTGRPQTDPRIGVGAAADWHRRFGVLIAAGPGVRQGTVLEDASILDVAPTVLAALGLPVALDLEGRVVQELFAAPLPVTAVDRYQPTDAAAQAAASAEASPVDDEMIARLRALGYIAPEGANALNNQGVMLMDAGRLAEAAATFSAALEREPRFLYAHINLGRARLLMKRYDEAMDSFRTALRLEPERVETLDLMGNVCMERGDLQAAAGWLERALRRQPDDAATLNSLGLLYQRQGKLQEAAAAFARVVQIDPDYVEGRNNIGLVLRQQGRLEEAIGAFRQAIETDPSFPGSYNNEGLVLQDMGRLPEARAVFARGLTVDPDNAILLNNLGALDLVEEKLDDARRRFEESIQADPDYPSARNNLGALEERRGDRGAARAQYEQAAALDPRYLDPRLNLARLDLQEGKLEEGDRRLREILAAAPDYPQALLQMGYLRARQGRMQEALQLAGAALRAMPGAADPHNLLAEIYMAEGRRDEAIQEMKRSLAANPQQPGLIEALRAAGAQPQ